jgi:hypothetical protein
MRIEHGYRPANRWLSRPLDERWRRWVTTCLGGAALVGVSMAAFVGPRQSVMRMRYEIAQLSEQVGRLEREQHRLLLERESLTSPEALAQQVAELGLAVPPRECVAYLGDDGRLLVFPAKPAAAAPKRNGDAGSRPAAAPAKGRR